jgi:hypothetical protein
MNVVRTARGAYGLAELAVPRTAMQAFRISPRRSSVLLTRLLGARELAQVTVSAVVPTRAVLGVGLAVDVLHALSMVGVATVSRRHRRAALTSAAMTSLFALAGAVTVRSAPRPRVEATTGEDDWRRRLAKVRSASSSSTAPLLCPLA